MRNMAKKDNHIYECNIPYYNRILVKSNLPRKATKMSALAVDRTYSIHF